MKIENVTIRKVLPVFFAVLLVFSAAKDVSGGEETGFSGRAIDILSEAPVPDAVITIKNPDISTITDSNGTYRLNADSGKYEVHIHASGYIDMSSILQKVVEGQRTNLDFHMIPRNLNPEQSEEIESELIVPQHPPLPEESDLRFIKMNGFDTRRRAKTTVPETIRVLMEDGHVEVMEMEEYLKGVLPIEMVPWWPLETLKAQAVVARSYAATANRHPNENANVCTTPHCQNWSSVHYSDTDRAVMETRQVVATYNGNIIQGFYFGHCDGRTRNIENVWNSQPVPYYKRVSCECGNTSLWGHGVGMCQRGAKSMANRGMTYTAILTHYYLGIWIDAPNMVEPVTPRVITNPLPISTEESATLMGTIVNPNGSSIVELKFNWGTYPASTGWANSSSNVQRYGDNFSLLISDLTPNTKYYFRASARNGVGWEIGKIESFRTQSAGNGILSINTTPVNGEIYVDGVYKSTGSWSGSVSLGSHVVSFGEVEGYDKPTEQTITVNTDQIITVGGKYTINSRILTGSIKVNINPLEAVDGGAQWKLRSDTVWLNGGDRKAGIPLGTYHIEFKAVEGWRTPSVKEVTVSEAEPEITVNNIIYTRLNASAKDTGILSIETVPVDGEIFIDGKSKGTGIWNGALTEGSYVISYGEVDGYVKPLEQTASVTADQVTSVTGNYISQRQILPGSLQVNVVPLEAVNEGAQWKLRKKNIWHNSGDRISDLPSGTYYIEFKTVEGWRTPPVKEVVISEAGSEIIIESIPYAQQGTTATGIILIKTTQANGEIYIDGYSKGTGTWNGTIAEGSYVISYGEVDGYVKPLEQPATVKPGQVTSVIGNYTPQQLFAGSLTVTIVPLEAANEGAQWKLKNDTTWLNSGDSKYDLSFGSYQIEFKPIDGWKVPPVKEVTLTEENSEQMLKSSSYIRHPEQGFKIQGTVVNLAGKGVSEAKVDAVIPDKDGKPDTVYSAFSDNEGKFEIDIEKEGLYYLVASKAGFGQSALKSYSTGETNAELSLTVLVSSSEASVENGARSIRVQIFDNGALTEPPLVTVIQGKGNLSVPARGADAATYETVYIPDLADDNDDVIGIKIEPEGEGEGEVSDIHYFFTLNQTKNVQTTFENVTQVGAQSMTIGQVTDASGQIIHEFDETSLEINLNKLRTPFGAKRTVGISRLEVEQSSVKSSVQQLGVSPMSAVYELTFMDPVSGEEKDDEIEAVKLKMQVTSSFDIGNWTLLISHEPSEENPDWHFASPAPDTISYDEQCQCLTFEIQGVYGNEGLVITSVPEQESGDGGGGGGSCFITNIW